MLKTTNRTLYMLSANDLFEHDNCMFIVEKFLFRSDRLTKDKVLCKGLFRKNHENKWETSDITGISHVFDTLEVVQQVDHVEFF